jgi:hypothetical protein
MTFGTTLVYAFLARMVDGPSACLNVTADRKKTLLVPANESDFPACSQALYPT